MSAADIDYDAWPDSEGFFGEHGGQFVAETLRAALQELEQAWRKLPQDEQMAAWLRDDLASYVGRPTPLYHAKAWSKALGGGQIYLKREDLNHTGAHKINNALGQARLALRMGKSRVIAETGAGQHGVATATVAARLGLRCRVYMGSEDMRRQRVNVLRMKMLGAEVAPVESGTKTLKDALNEALRDWVTNVDDTFYIIGSVAGPHPYPALVRDFQSVIGREARSQCLEQTGRLPDLLVACVGGGSNAIGLFHPFLDDENVAMVGVEAAGQGLASGHHAAPLCCGSPGILHGNHTLLVQDADGQIQPTHSIAPGLDYPGVGPQHAWLKQLGRVRYVAADDRQALAACHSLARCEGIIPALETSHALAWVIEEAPRTNSEQIVVVNLSGRGDKDLEQIFAQEEFAS